MDIVQGDKTFREISCLGDVKVAAAPPSQREGFGLTGRGMPTTEGIMECSFSNNLDTNIWRREARETQLLLQVKQGKSPINKMSSLKGPGGLESLWKSIICWEQSQ